LLIGTLNDGKAQRAVRATARRWERFKALAKRMDSEHVLKSDAGREAARAFKSAGFKANEINQSTLS
jgi:hypothetical protein